MLVNAAAQEQQAIASAFGGGGNNSGAGMNNSNNGSGDSSHGAPIGAGGELATAAGGHGENGTTGDTAQAGANGGGGSGGSSNGGMMSMLGGMFGGTGGAGGDGGGGMGATAGDGVGTEIAGAFQNGGAIPDGYTQSQERPDFMDQTQQPTVLAFANGGPVPGNGDPSSAKVDGFGVSSGATQGIPGFANGGQVTPVLPDYVVPYGSTSEGASSGGLVNVTGQEQQGLQNAVNVGSQVAANFRATQNYNEQQRANKAQKQALSHQLTMQTAQDIKSHELNDDGVPNNQAAISTGNQAQVNGSSDAAGATAQGQGDPNSAAANGTTSPDTSAPGPAEGPQPEPAQGAIPNAPQSQGAPQAPQGQGPTSGQAIPAPAPPGAPAPAQPAPAQATPNAAPAPDPVQGAQAIAAKNPIAPGAPVPDAVAGGNQQGKAPHSIPKTKWTQWSDDNVRAAMATAEAGGDGAAQLKALNDTMVAWSQGHVTRWMSVAHSAALTGDTKGVETALKNAYYYVPDGQELNFQHDAQGNLQFQDPIHPYVDNKGNVSYTPKAGFQPNMIPANAQAIQTIGTAMLNPNTVNDLIIGARAAEAKANLEVSQAGADVEKGHASTTEAQAKLIEAGTKARRVGAQNYKDLSLGDRARAQGEWFRNRLVNTQKNLKLDPQVQKIGLDAAHAADDLALGPQKTTPSMVPQTDPKTGKPVLGPDGKPVLIPNMVANAGRNERDNSRAAPYLQNMKGEQYAMYKSNAADIAMANVRSGMSAQRAAYIASLMVRYRGDDGKNYLIDKSQNTGHVRDPATGQMIDFYLSPQATGDAAQGNTEASEEELSRFSPGGTGGAIPGGESGEEE